MTMSLATISDDSVEWAVLRDRHRGVIRIADIDASFSGNVMDVITDGTFAALSAAAMDAPGAKFSDPDSVSFAAPYRRPRKIWGIGLNYRDHAADLSEAVPDQPASFVKCDHTIIGPDGQIVIPDGIGAVTSEAELGLVIGRVCENVEEADALDYVWGVTTILDQTAGDILSQDPRYLTRAKNFPTFFGFGPELVPFDRVLQEFGSIEAVEISTVRNNTEARTGRVANMRHSPASLVSFHSKMMPLFPGDIISTGTPGALEIRPGDQIECRIPGIGSLVSMAAESAYSL